MLWDEIIALPGSVARDLEVLKASGLPFVLYGDGWYAPYVREYLARYGLKPAASFTDAGFTSSGESVSFDEVRGRFERFNVIIAFANAALARKKLEKMDRSRVAGIYFFDVMSPLLDNNIDRAYLELNKERFCAVHGLFCDELSRQTYAAFINSKLGGTAGYLDEVWRKEQYFPKGIIGLSGSEVFVDGGAYTGDTLLTFMRLSGGKYAKCYAFEPDPANAAKLNATVAKRGLRDVNVVGKGLWSKAAALPFAVWQGTSASSISGTGEATVEVDAIDNMAPDATFIKMDIEGAELEALKGAAGTIKRNHPKLAICLYHKPGDLIEIPLFIKALVPEYKLYLRQHQPVSCELVLYAVK